MDMRNSVPSDPGTRLCT